MAALDLEKYKALLLHLRAELIEDIKLFNPGFEAETEYKSTTASHLADIGTDTMQMEQKYYFAAFGGSQLHELDLALYRIDSGRFGRCTACGYSIDEERLAALPQAKKCVSCKLLDEK